MNEFLYLYRNNKRVKYTVNLVGINLLGLFVVLLIYFIFDRTLISGLNGSFVAFFILFGYGTLKWLVNMGTFDSMSYGFSNMTYAWKKGAPVKYKDLIDYREQHAERRKRKKFEFVLWYISSALFLVITIILYVVYRLDISSRLALDIIALI